MKQALRDNFEFLRQFRERFHTTGAVLPSSRFLAKAMTGPFRERSDRVACWRSAREQEPSPVTSARAG
ncbi:MAG: hypothetical protein R3B90_05075 [Planctomycetaceae bacterium]